MRLSWGLVGGVKGVHFGEHMCRMLVLLVITNDNNTSNNMIKHTPLFTRIITRRLP